MIALKQTVLRDIGAIARTIQSLCDVSYKGLGLQKGQFVFLTRICENPGINQNRLSELVRVDKTTTTKAIQKLEALGYIDKTTDGEDGRARLLAPSPKARDIYDVLIADENDNLDICLSGFREEEVRLLSALLVRMRGNLDRHRIAARRPAGEKAAP